MHNLNTSGLRHISRIGMTKLPKLAKKLILVIENQVLRPLRGCTPKSDNFLKPQSSAQVSINQMVVNQPSYMN